MELHRAVAVSGSRLLATYRSADLQSGSPPEMPPLQGGFYWTVDPGLKPWAVLLSHFMASKRSPPITFHLSPLTSHLSLLLLRDLLASGFGAEFVSKEREKIGYVGDLLLQRTPDTMPERVNSEQDRISRRRSRLQPGREFK
jgi:hypothetical protein